MYHLMIIKAPEHEIFMFQLKLPQQSSGKNSISEDYNVVMAQKIWKEQIWRGKGFEYEIQER